MFITLPVSLKHNSTDASTPCASCSRQQTCDWWLLALEYIVEKGVENEYMQQFMSPYMSLDGFRSAIVVVVVAALLSSSRTNSACFSAAAAAPSAIYCSLAFTFFVDGYCDRRCFAVGFSSSRREKTGQKLKSLDWHMLRCSTPSLTSQPVWCRNAGRSSGLISKYHPRTVSVNVCEVRDMRERI